MKKIILFALALSLVAGCSMSVKSSSFTADRCATKVAQALTSSEAVVAGSFDCLSPVLTKANGWKSDEDVQKYASTPPVVGLDKACGKRTVDLVTPMGGNLVLLRHVTGYVFVVHLKAHPEIGAGWLTLVPDRNGKIVDSEMTSAPYEGCP
ncbi:MAG: hypothetical protein PVSMB1_04150 [Gemmatimonadaceae bacterium]